MSQNALIYTRVSTKEQAEGGYSLSNQDKECKKFAIDNNYSILNVYEERGESAKTTDRTELQKLMKYCFQNKKDIDVLIVWKLDRLARNMEDFYSLTNYFNKLNIRVLSATEVNGESATEKLTRNMLGAFAQFENDQKSERVTAGMKEAFKQGNWLWKTPKGYTRKFGMVIPDPETAPIITKIFEKFSTGLYKQTQLIKYAEKNGIKMQASTMNHMLRNPFYIGYMVKGKWSEEPIRGSFEPIVSDKIFNKVQAILEGRKPIISGYKRNNPEYPLRQFITCPNCNQPLSGSPSKGRSKKYPYYHCYNKDCSINFRIPVDRLHKVFVEYLKEIKPASEFLDLFQLTVEDVHNQRTENRLNKSNELDKRLIKLKETKSKLIDYKLDGSISQADYSFKSEQLNSQIKEVEYELSTLSDTEEDLTKCLKYTCNVVANLDEVWLNGSLDIRQRLQRLIFPKGLTYDLSNFRTAEISSLFKIIGSLKEPSYNMVPPSEFESLSTP